MSDRVIYGRPITVTEERLKEAVAKQAKQKALKEALDRQLLDRENAKAEARRAKGVASRPVAHGRDATASPSARGCHIANSEQLPDHGESNVATPKGLSPSLTQPPPRPARSSTSARNSKSNTPLPPERYSFECHDGVGAFIHYDHAQGDVNVTVGSSPRSIDKGNGTGVSGRAPRSPRSPRRTGGNTGESFNRPSKDRPVVSPKSKGRVNLTRGRGRGGSTTDRRQTGAGVHETRSLPVDFTKVLGGLMMGRGEGGAAPSSDSKSAQRTGAIHPTYETNSLPVDVSCGNRKGWSPDDQITRGGRVPLLRRGDLPRNDDADVRWRNGITQSPAGSSCASTDEYDRNCLPPNFSMEELRKIQQSNPTVQSPKTATSPFTGPVALKKVRGRGGGPPRSPAKAALSPSRVSRFQTRPPGGVLPPLGDSRPTSVSSQQLNVIEMSGILGQEPTSADNGGTLRVAAVGRVGGQRSASKESRRTPTRPPLQVPGSEVERLQKQLESRDAMMDKLRQKEKGWEEQVKQLKIELKNARKKERDLNRLATEQKLLRRAESAPDYASAPSKPKNGGLLQQQIRRGTPASAAGGARPLGKADFLTARRFTPETFSPITAPDLPGASYVSPRQLPPLSAGESSLKLASLNSYKTALGLAQDNAEVPAYIEYEHLNQFVEAKIITFRQAKDLWLFFGGDPSCFLACVPDDAPQNSSTEMSWRPSESGGSAAPENNGQWKDHECSGSVSMEEVISSADESEITVKEHAQDGADDSSWECQTPKRRAQEFGLPQNSPNPRSDYQQPLLSAMLTPSLRQKLNRSNPA